jgi:hypothetical protein
MKYLASAILFILAAIPAFAADQGTQRIPANEYCFVWVGNEKGEFVDRKELRFVLDVRDPSLLHFERDFPVDDQVRAYILASVNGYRLTLYKNGQKERPLASGFYNRTGIPNDFNTTGFEVYTKASEYSMACVTESYLQ